MDNMWRSNGVPLPCFVSGYCSLNQVIDKSLEKCSSLLIFVLLNPLFIDDSVR